MRKIIFGITTLLLIPAISHAQSLQTLFENITIFLDAVIIPFLLGIAFVIFVVNAVRFFVFGSSNEIGREKAKALAIYSVAAFVLIIIFNGIINLISSSIGLDGKDQPTSDYIEEMGS